MHSLPQEWLPASIAPSNGELEICILDFDGLVHSLAFPCRKVGAEWFDGSGTKHPDIQPTQWRKWTEYR
jgi:hypothetical protein